MARRGLNLLVALVGIVITLPIWIVTAILIKLTSRGPAFHVQIRVGQCKRQTGATRHDPRRTNDIGGRPFRIYKFRTMYVDAEARTGPVWAVRNDPRLTPIGKVLRQNSIGKEVRRQFPGQSDVYVRADKNLTWGNLAQVISALDEAGLKQKLVTKPEDRTK